MNGTQGNAASKVRKGNYFFTVIIGLVTLIIVTGFAPTFYLGRLFQADSLSPLLITHGIVFTTWLGLAIVQSLLIQAHRKELHRQLGVLGALLAAAMVILGFNVAIEAVHSSPWPARFKVDPHVFLIIPLAQITIFAALVTAAIAMRRNGAVHKRLMLLAIINLAPPAISRIGYSIFHVESPLLIVGTLTVLVLACIVHDKKRYGKVHPVFSIVGPITVLTFPLRMAIAGTNAWMRFAMWLTN